MRRTSHRQTVNGNAFWKYTLKTSLLGQLLSQTGLGSVSTRNSTGTYTYDTRGRLKSQSTKLQTDSTHTYTNSGTFAYDAANNLKPSSGWTYNQNNQLTAAPATQGLAGATGLSYDASGNLQTINGMTLTYDCWGHTTSVANTASGTVKFSYDSSGRRISKTVGTTTTFNVWDGDTLVAQTDSAGNFTRDYTFGGTGALSDHASGSADRIYASDPQGNTMDTLDGASGVLRHPPFIASPFGFGLGTPPADEIMIYGPGSLLPDSELSSGTGAQTFYQGATTGGRPYVPGTGSYGSPSAPSGFGGGGSPYGFGGGNPLDNDDDNTDYTSDSQFYGPSFRRVGNGLMTGALFLADGNPIEATRQFLSGRGALGNKLSVGDRLMAAFNAAAAVAGPLSKAAEEVPAVARGINKAREAAAAAKQAAKVARGNKLVPVSRWGREGLQPGDFVMKGPANYWNWLRSFKWERTPYNQFAPLASGRTYPVPASSIRWPRGRGMDGRWKGLFGQRIYDP